LALGIDRNKEDPCLVSGSRLCSRMQRERSLPLRPPCLEVFIRLSPCPPVERPQRARNLVGSAPSHRSGTKPASVKASHRHLAVPDGSASYSRAPAPAPSQARAVPPPSRPVRHLAVPAISASHRCRAPAAHPAFRAGIYAPAPAPTKAAASKAIRRHHPGYFPLPPTRTVTEGATSIVVSHVRDKDRPPTSHPHSVPL